MSNSENLTPLAFALDQCRRNSDLDDFIIQEIVQTREVIRFVMFASTYADLRHDRPELIVRILEQYMDMHGPAKLLSMSRQYHIEPSILAPIRMICGIDSFLVSGPDTFSNRKINMARHFLDRMSAHQWVHMISALGTPQDALRHPETVDAYFDALEGRA